MDLRPFGFRAQSYVLMAVSSSRKSPSAPSSSFPWHLVLLLVVFAMVLFFGFFGVSVLSSHGQAVESATSSLADPALVVSKPQLRTADTVVSSINSTKDVAVSAPSSCETVELEVSSTTGIGKVTMKMHHDWAPLGAARFCELVEKKFYDDVRFFRVLKVSHRLVLIVSASCKCPTHLPSLAPFPRAELHGANRHER
jgi:hypothetical protein